MKNAFYAQSGGVTSVINSSAYGVISELQARDASINIFASQNGIVGLLEDKLYDLGKTKKSLELLKDSPAGMFGSCRYKLPALTEKPFYENLFQKLDQKSIKYFFYNGGNDSADTCLKVSQAAKDFGYELYAVAVPKTIDNDLAVTDNCPGFGSVAKYIATSAKEASLDIKSMCKTSTKVFILEVMGRHAGWIAASAELANDSNNTYVHKILLPEVSFDESKFLAGVEEDVKNYGYSVVVASEGLKDKNGEIYSASSEKDSFGHSQLGGLAPKIANLVSNNLNLKYHWSVSDYLQRSARHLASKTDLEQAVAVGKRAVEFALSEKSGIMPVIQRVSEDPYQWSISEGDLKDIANEEKVLPNDYISDCGFRITPKGVNYLNPLIQGEDYPRYDNGVPAYEQLDLHLAD
ncbi:MAG: 6-phosphofructokinase [SAR86 cluster bacterium]|uniref:Pyrophosphate--fructose 6-phosphate 1-phosphotransferase n=1 Tax=SAR86 cluster bacterium TaxID=2030880 RepID=A0A368BRC2_9GAMM|nr:MAG: 6-phosphofructokinase [SAR86 cluster bacterium]|tara:strand:- start:6408 stop:7628 length:1221 start_codon:yes stop_codon:yes gene_type:complete